MCTERLNYDESIKRVVPLVGGALDSQVLRIVHPRGQRVNSIIQRRLLAIGCAHGCWIEVAEYQGPRHSTKMQWRINIA